jgi:hypothetical protein
MIMLHLHGQNTAAFQQLKVSGQATLQKLTRKDVFVKQADMKSLPNSSKEIRIHMNNIKIIFTNCTIITIQNKDKVNISI